MYISIYVSPCKPWTQELRRLSVSWESDFIFKLFLSFVLNVLKAAFVLIKIVLMVFLSSTLNKLIIW